ncbi:MAG: DUF2281 domain-containing protein [candidate division KSB1 bacterium]|nr:DUF2281 domain-containing protein [candidate division KSB1 bacterium]MDZ7369174.1 DUF2281 domain-containing protein [candidate division KSB1 bacterium]MDZ7407132.1 DUF2281 domain-containing protein [candidate division KSB1 bacterium]
METIEKKMKQLTEEMQGEVADFIDFLLAKKVGAVRSKRKKKPKLNWIGGLKEYRNQFSALELQKKALEWRD